MPGLIAPVRSFPHSMNLVLFSKHRERDLDIPPVDRRRFIRFGVREMAQGWGKIRSSKSVRLFHSVSQNIPADAQQSCRPHLVSSAHFQGLADQVFLDSGKGDALRREFE